MKYVWLIIGMAVVTYIPRVLPSLFLDRIRLSKNFEMFLQLIPYTAMTALIFPNILHVDTDRNVGLIGALCAVLCAWCRMPTIVVVVVSIFACFLTMQFTI